MKFTKGYTPWNKLVSQEEVRDEFWSRVKPPVGIGECWEWIGGKNHHGYGRMDVFGKKLYAHRLAYEQVFGKIPDGLTIDHLCRNHGCVNPYHMEVVTIRTNVLRGESFNAQNARKTHCKHGHEFTPENTYYRPNGGRNCKICRKEADRAAYQRKKLCCLPHLRGRSE